MRIKMGAICLLIFVIGVAMFASARAHNTVVLAKPFVLTYLVSKVKDGKAEFTGVTIRVVKKNGEWKETRQTFDGNNLLWLATIDAQYVMRPGMNVREFVSQYNLDRDKAFRSQSFLENHPQFIRREEFLGLIAYVLRAGNGETYMEEYYAPECGSSLLKRIMVQGDEQDIIEAVKLEFRNVSDDEVSLPQTPLQFNRAEERVDAFRGNGLMTQADALSLGIEKAKKKAKE